MFTTLLKQRGHLLCNIFYVIEPLFCCFFGSDENRRTLELPIFRETDLSKIIFIFRLEVQRRHVIEDDRDGAEGLFGMFKGYSFDSCFVHGVERIHEAVDVIHIDIEASIAIQILRGFELAFLMSESRHHEVTEERFCYRIESDAIKQRPEDVLGTDGANGCVRERAYETNDRGVLFRECGEQSALALNLYDMRTCFCNEFLDSLGVM